MKTAIVTGATGFIGYHLCKKLYREKYKVIAIGCENENNPECDILYKTKICNIPWNEINNIDVCFHQAANNNTLDIDEAGMIEANVFQTEDLFNKLIQKKCKKFIYASSCSVYGSQSPPYIEDETKIECLNVYAKSKFLLEEFAQKFAKENKVVCVGLRYSNVYGPKEKHKEKRASMIYQITNNIANNKEVRLFKYGEQKRDWVFVEDVVEANIIFSKLNFSDVFNVGSGESTSFNSILSIINKELNKNTVVEYVDCDFLEKYQENTCLDLNKSNRFGYFPKHSIEKGVKKLVKEEFTS